MVIYKKLAAARKVTLPHGVSQEDQTLFAGVDQPDPMDVLAGIHDPGNGGEPASVLEKAAVPAIPTTAIGKHISSWKILWASKKTSICLEAILAGNFADPHAVRCASICRMYLETTLKHLLHPA